MSHSKVLKYLPAEIVEYWAGLTEKPNTNIFVKYEYHSNNYQIILNTDERIFPHEILAVFMFDKNKNIQQERYYFGIEGWFPCGKITTNSSKEFIQYLKLKTFE